MIQVSYETAAHFTLKKHYVTDRAHRDKTRFMTKKTRRRVFGPCASVEAVILIDGMVEGT